MLASFDRVAALVVDELSAAPCAVAAASLGTGAAIRRDIGVWGALTREAGAPDATHDTPFDLASVTKSFVAVSLARLAKRGKISFDEPLGSVLPDLSNTPVGDCPLELLLAHRSGLAAHRQRKARIHAIARQFGQTVTPNRIVRHPRQERCRRTLACQDHSDIAGRAADGRSKALCIFDACAGGIGVKIHPDATKNHKVVQLEALPQPLHHWSDR